MPVLEHTQETCKIQHFYNIVPGVLALTQEGILVHSADNVVQCAISFTDTELRLLVPLLENYPHYCPYEVLYASFFYGTTDENTVTSTRNYLYSLTAKERERKLKIMRNVLSKIRGKLKRIGITIVSLIETGCILKLR
jgi:hypothetical protein